MTLLIALLVLAGPFLVAAPGLIAAAFQAPEFFRPRPSSPLRHYRWAPA
jgi:hypothetical protein